MGETQITASRAIDIYGGGGGYGFSLRGDNLFFFTRRGEIFPKNPGDNF